MECWCKIQQFDVFLCIIIHKLNLIKLLLNHNLVNNKTNKTQGFNNVVLEVKKKDFFFFNLSIV